MLRINRQTDYAIRIILYLAKEPLGTRIPSKKIRDEMLIPKALTPQIVAELAHAEFITTYPGRDGGVELSRAPEDVNMWDIINLFEGPVYLSECLVQGQSCPFQDKCPVRLRWNPLHDVIRREMEKVTFADLVHDAKTLKAFSLAES